jgi:hypothetical protein
MVSAGLRRFTHVAVLCGVVVSGACTGTSSPSDAGVSVRPPNTDQAPSAPAASGSVPCGQAIDAPADVSPDDVVVLDNVALPVGRTLQVNPAGSDSELPLFAKHGLVVRAGTMVELRVPPEWEPRVRVGWGSPAAPAPEATVSACPARGHAPWLAFAGGYWVDAPVCFPLIVRTQGRETLVRIGAGAQCST